MTRIPKKQNAKATKRVRTAPPSPVHPWGLWITKPFYRFTMAPGADHALVLAS